MARVKDTAEGATLTRTVAANIIAGLGAEDQPFGTHSVLLDRGDARGGVDGRFRDDDPTGAAGSGPLKDGKGAGRDGRAMPLFNVFRPF